MMPVSTLVWLNPMPDHHSVSYLLKSFLIKSFLNCLSAYLHSLSHLYVYCKDCQLLLRPV